MTSRQLLYKSKTSPIKYIIPATFLIIATAGYFYGLNYFIVGLLAFGALTSAFSDTLTIKVYSDGFEFNYSNVFGQFLAVNNSFLYADIKNYKCEITQWRANFKQGLLIVVVEYFLPGRTRTELRNDPKAHITIDTKNPLNEIDQYEVTLILDEWTHKKALDLINKTLNK